MSSEEPTPERIGTIWHMRLAEAPPPVEPGMPATFGHLGPESAPELASAMGLADPSVVRQRLASGRRCYALRAGDSLATYGWVSFDGEDIGGLGLHLQLLPGETYIWDCATQPDFRGRGLYPALLGRIVAALAAEGLRSAWIGADYHNHPSHAGINRAGFLPLADLVAAPAAAGERRRLGWLVARPGIGPRELAEAERVYLGGSRQAWLFDEEG
jgi:GNAT superfamily N-acetyltransferase